MRCLLSHMVYVFCSHVHNCIVETIGQYKRQSVEMSKITSIHSDGNENHQHHNTMLMMMSKFSAFWCHLPLLLQPASLLGTGHGCSLSRITDLEVFFHIFNLILSFLYCGFPLTNHERFYSRLIFEATKMGFLFEVSFRSNENELNVC